jgi:hypothetical protein
MRSIEELFEQAWEGKLLTQYEIKWVMQKMIEVLVKEPNVKYLNSGITLVGDIHGYIISIINIY